ncbi:hypothetical protein IEC33019_0437 [Pseudomonas putida]|uniref:Uncharacterized protein n=1 Tax=Pseudomonas putida TaxID=303 RepID=A0A1B2F1D5_PSEPU|nr:hypothetical protein IEC33019_0437 [Pseudomonas putida]
MERSPLYFQFVSEHPRAIEEELPCTQADKATVLLAFDKGEVQEMYIGLYVASEACLVEYVLPHCELEVICRRHVVDRGAALDCARQKAEMRCRLH